MVSQSFDDVIDGTDTDPVTIRAGETTVVARQVQWADPELASRTWKARCQVRTAPGGTLLESPAATIADGVVQVAWSAADTAAFTWSSGVIGIEVYDDSVAPEIAYRLVQAPITVTPEVVQ